MALSGWRSLRGTPWLSAAVVVVLGLGMAVALAGFLLVDAVLFRPLGIVDQQAVYRIGGSNLERRWLNSNSWPAYQEMAQSATAFSGLVAEGFPGALNWQEQATEVRRVDGRLVSGNYFEVLGVQPALGRLLEPADDRPGAEPVLVVSHAFWTSTLQRDPEVIGRRLQINGVAHTVVGVVAADFRGMDVLPLQVWLPLMPNVQPVEAFTDAGFQMFEVFGRLRADATEAQALAQLDAVAQRVARMRDGGDAWMALDPVTPALARMRDEAIRGSARLLAWSVGLLLAIATANAAGLLLVRGERRRAELGLRRMLGAGHRHLLSDLLREGAVHAALAMLLGAGLAVVLVQVGLASGAAQVLRLDPQDLPDVWRTSAVLIAVVALVVLLVTLVPALRVWRGDAGIAVRTRRDNGESRGRRWRFGRWMVVGQLALTVVLLVAAAMLMDVLQRRLQLPTGYAHTDTQVMALPRSDADSQMPPALHDARTQALLQAVRSAPGVRAAAVGWAPVTMSSMTTRATLPQRSDGGSEPVFVLINLASDHYFSTLGVRMLEGRDLSPQDLSAGAPLVAVISADLARERWPGQSVLGQQIHLGAGQGQPARVHTIVGVVDSVRYRPEDRRTEPVVHLPYTQRAFGRPMEVLVRAEAPAAGVAALRSAVRQVTPELAPGMVESLAARQARYLAPHRFLAGSTGLFAGLGVVLAALGLAGLFSYLVQVRQRELGLRMAIGARAGAVYRMVLADGGRLVLTGLLIGAGLALYAGRVLLSWVNDTQVPSLAHLLLLALVLTAAATLAVSLPARRAARLDPQQVLRDTA